MNYDPPFAMREMNFHPIGVNKKKKKTLQIQCKTMKVRLHHFFLYKMCSTLCTITQANCAGDFE